MWAVAGRSGMRAIGLSRVSVLLLLVTCVAACGSSDATVGDARCGNGDVLVSGTVERDLVASHQYTGATDLLADSSARITLWSNPAFGGDGPSKLVAEQTLQPAPALPFSFCLTGSTSLIAEPVEYAVSAEVRQHEAGSTVGDLTTEVIHEVQPPATKVVVRVVGLEDCSDQNAGGFCLQP